MCMEKIFLINDRILHLQSNVKKYRNYTKATREEKINELYKLKNDLRIIISKNKHEFSEIDYNSLVSRYKKIQTIVKDTVKLLQGRKGSDSTESEEIFEMPSEGKLDISLAIKLIERFDGDSTKLLNFIENVNLLQSYSTGVPIPDIISFVKTRLIGPAHGAIDGAATLNQVADKLKTKFGVRITPKAIENEMLTLKQGKKTISEFGTEINNLAAKLAAAHVSQGTFDNEASAAAIVQPIAVNAFSTGLRDTQTSFFIKARNPTSLTKAISDALEVAPIPAFNPENALWIGTNRKFPNQSSSIYQNNQGQFTPRNSVNKYGFHQKRNYDKYRNFNKPNFDNNRNYNYNRNHNYKYPNYNQYRNNNNRYNQNFKNRRNQVNLVSSQSNTDDQHNTNQQEVNSLDLFRTFSESCD